MNFSKSPFTLTLILLILSGISLILNHSGFALRLLNLTFWIAAASTILYIWEARKNEN